MRAASEKTVREERTPELGTRETDPLVGPVRVTMVALARPAAEAHEGVQQVKTYLWPGASVPDARLSKAAVAVAALLLLLEEDEEVEEEEVDEEASVVAFVDDEAEEDEEEDDEEEKAAVSDADVAKRVAMVVALLAASAAVHS